MDHSPFSKISAEIRNQIYELVLVHDRPIAITADNYESKLRTTDLSQDRHPLALLCTCKQISNESTALFYGNNSIRFEFMDDQENEEKDELCLVQRFCASIGDTALTGLRDIHVHTGRAFERRDKPNAHTPEVFPRILLGLQGISVLNDELRIKCTIEGNDETFARAEVTATLQIEDLETTLEAALASFKLSSARSARNATRHSLILSIHEELRFFQATAFGSNEAPSKSVSQLAKNFSLSF